MNDVLAGGIIAITAAVVTSLFQRTREHRRWLREARQQLYYELLQALHEASQANSRLWEAVGRSDGGLSEAEAQPYLDELIRHDKLLEPLYLQMRIIASPSVLRLADDFTTRPFFIADRFAGETMFFGPVTERFDDDLGWPQLERFVEVARADLGSETIIESIGAAPARAIGSWRGSRSQRAYRRKTPEQLRGELESSPFGRPLKARSDAIGREGIGPTTNQQPEDERHDTATPEAEGES